MDMFDLLAHRARVTPERPALEDLENGERYNYRQFNQQAARLAAAARNHWGLKKGDRLAYLGHSRAEFFIMLFGCAKADLILVPLNWRLAVPELEFLVEDCAPGALVFGAEFADVAEQLQAGCASPMELVALDQAATDQRHYHADLAATDPDLSAHPDKDPDTPWYLLYTSGTTGRPKGVIQTFRMMLANYLNIGLAVNLNGDDVLLNVLPLFHTAGINLYSSAVFIVGGSVLVARTFEPDQALQVLEKRATVFFGVPAVYEALLDHPNFNGDRLKGIRSWGCGGAPLSLPVAQRYVDQGIRVRTGMGMTETGPTVFLLDEDKVIEKIGSVGRPQLLTEVRIVDHDGNDVPRGEAGELLVRGPNITPGYWNRPEATAEAIRADGWLHSGDVALCDEDGHYFIVDRWKDMYISGGENVYPAEVEKVLAQHPAISEVAVVGMADERWGEVGKAYYSPQPNQEAPETEALRGFCREHLAAYKVPKAFERVDALPRNALGKVTKQALREHANKKTTDMTQNLVLSQTDFDRFARISGDHNPIHVDPDYAANTPFGATVSHGMLLFSRVRGLIHQFFPDARLEVQDLKFPAPAYADEPLKVILEAQDQPKDGIVHLTTKVLKEDDRHCLQGSCRLKLAQEVTQ